MPDVVHVGSRQDPTLKVRELVSELVNDVESVVGRDVEERLQDEAGVLRIPEQVVARLDPLKDLRDLVMVPRVLRKRDDGPVPEQKDRDLFDVDLRVRPRSNSACSSSRARQRLT